MGVLQEPPQRDEHGVDCVTGRNRRIALVEAPRPPFWRVQPALGEARYPRASSEMDAVVKQRLVLGWVGGHGGVSAGVGRPARDGNDWLVTLRFAGRDRMTVSGRELPRTKVASRNRIEDVEGPPVDRRRPPGPSRWRCSGSGVLLVA
jgi:hypothetical protein